MSLFASANLSAEVTGIQVSDGENSVTFYLGDRPEVSFTDTELIVSAEETVVSYPLTSEVTFEFVDDSGIDRIKNDDVTFFISLSEIAVTGLKPNESVLFFNLSGKLIHSVYADAAGECRVSTDILPKETLIIKTNKSAYKFLIGK